MQDPKIDPQPKIFEWYQNRIEDGLQAVYQRDRAERQAIVGIIQEMNDSGMFWKLMAAYTNEIEAAPSDFESNNEALKALLARVYIAGTLRGAAAIAL